MNAKLKLVLVLMATITLASIQGCTQKEKSEPGETGTEPASSLPSSQDGNQMAAQDTSISDLVALWSAQEKDQAVEKFRSIDWQDADILKPIRGLSMSEETLGSLSEDECQSIVQETMDLLDSMRKLFFHIASEAESLASSGDTSTAETYLTAVRTYGTRLSGPEHLEVVQLHGKAAVGYADKKLSELK